MAIEDKSYVFVLSVFKGLGQSVYQGQASLFVHAGKTRFVVRVLFLTANRCLSVLNLVARVGMLVVNHIALVKRARLFLVAARIVLVRRQAVIRVCADQLTIRYGFIAVCIMGMLLGGAGALALAVVGVLREGAGGLATVVVGMLRNGAAFLAASIMGVLAEVAGALAVAVVGVLREVAGALALAVVAMRVLPTGQNRIRFIALIRVRLGALGRFTAVRFSSSREARVSVRMAGFHGFLGFPADQNWLCLGGFAVVAVLGMGVLLDFALQLGLNGSRQRGEHHAGAQGEGHHDRQKFRKKAICFHN
ncbi:MAG: hypothetical protein HFF31_06205 [Flavonifractor sp.]|nr:hypothetical protein [Flavonifractor sp.]